MTGKKLGILIGAGGKRTELLLSPEAEKELEDLRKEVEKTMLPLYRKLGVNPETEDLYWANNEVYAKNKVTGERRELIGRTQGELNKEMWQFGLDNLVKEKRLVEKLK